MLVHFQRKCIKHLSRVIASWKRHPWKSKKKKIHSELSRVWTLSTKKLIARVKLTTFVSWHKMTNQVLFFFLRMLQQQPEATDDRYFFFLHHQTTNDNWKVIEHIKHCIMFRCFNSFCRTRMTVHTYAPMHINNFWVRSFDVDGSELMLMWRLITQSLSVYANPIKVKYDSIVKSSHSTQRITHSVPFSQKLIIILFFFFFINPILSNQLLLLHSKNCAQNFVDEKKKKENEKYLYRNC